MIDTLIKRILELNNPSVVGLDPRLDFIPEFIKQEAYGSYGQTLKGASDAYLRFNKAIIDQIADIVPAVKPQIAMYEQFGYEGIKAYLDTIEYAKSKGLIVIGDIKRSDIASTAEAYSHGHIGRVKVEEHSYCVYKEDFITLNPYLGVDSIEPYMNDCQKYNKGLFILVKTSNPNGGQIQDLSTDGKRIYEVIGSLVSEWGQASIGSYGFSQVGAVVGATYKKQCLELRTLMPHTFFLVPGYGAQGAGAKDIADCFNKNGLGAIVNSSRGIIAAYKKDKYASKYSEKEFHYAARQAAEDMKKDINSVIQ